MARKRSMASRTRYNMRKKLRKEFADRLSTVVKPIVFGRIKEGQKVLGVLGLDVKDGQHYFNLHLGNGKYEPSGWTVVDLQQILRDSPDYIFEEITSVART